MADLDYNQLMLNHLSRVFGEHDSARRLAAIGEICTEDATLYEPDAIATGHAAINDAVTALLSSLPPGFAFTATGPAIGHHNLGRLRWQSGPAGGPAVVTGMDVAQFKDGQISALYVLLDPPSA